MRIHTASRFQDLANVYRKSSEFFESTPELLEQLNESLGAFKYLLDLIPQDLARLSSGHVFPFFEADMDLEFAVHQALQGMYKPAMVSLRGFLELSMVSVYFDKDDNVEVAIKNWLSSGEDTPYYKNLRNKIFALPGFRKVQDGFDLVSELDEQYYYLCDFAHTKGMKFSNRILGGRLSNVATFNIKSLRKFIENFRSVVRLSLALHLIKYPVGLLYAPLYEKFGFDRPLGTFLEPEQSEAMRLVIGEPLVNILQLNAETDSLAQEKAAWVVNHPTLTEEEQREKLMAQYRFEIEQEGWLHWIDNIGKFVVGPDDDLNLEEQEERKSKFNQLEKWARENDHYEVKLHFSKQRKS